MGHEAPTVLADFRRVPRLGQVQIAFDVARGRAGRDERHENREGAEQRPAAAVAADRASLRSHVSRHEPPQPSEASTSAERRSHSA